MPSYPNSSSPPVLIKRLLVGVLCLVLLGTSAALVAPSATAQSVLDDAVKSGTVVEEVIPKNDTDWWYNDSLRDLGTTWRGVDYTYGPDWKNAQARFGNDGCCNTLLDVDPFENAVYLRKEFTVDTRDEITAMEVSFQYDDAAILWLNGTEVYRTIRGNLPETGEVPYDYDVKTGGAEDLYVEMPGNNYVEQHPELGNDLTVWVPAVDTANLREGKNVFAIMLFNRRGSTDTSTDLALRLTREITPDPTPTPTPNIGDPPDVIGFTTVEASTGCLPNSGRIDVAITNASDNDKSYTVAVGSITRTVTIPANETEKVAVSGRPDGPFLTTVSDGATEIYNETLTVNCSPNVEVTIENSCLANNGRLDFFLKNITNETATYTVEVGNLAPRRRAILPAQSKRVTVTGRPDADFPVTVKRDGVTIKTDTITVDCDPNIPALVKTSCLAGNGRIDTALMNLTSTRSRFEVTVSGLAPRSRMLNAGASNRVAITGRPDGDYTVTVTRDGTAIHNETVTIACDR